MADSLLWLVVSTPLAYLIYSLVEPTYEAFSLLQVQPAKENVFYPSSGDGTDRIVAQPYMETQVQLIDSDKVLDAALSRPGTTRRPDRETADDPELEGPEVRPSQGDAGRDREGTPF